MLRGIMKALIAAKFLLFIVSTCLAVNVFLFETETEKSAVVYL